MKFDEVTNIKRIIKLKLNITIIFSILLTLTFMYYDGDKYLTNILQEDETVVQALTNPSEDIEEIEEINKEEESKVEEIPKQEVKQETTNVVPINVTPQNSTVNQSNWHWPTTSNYLITNYYNSSHKALDIYSYDGYNSNIYAANKGTVVEVKGGCVTGDLSCNGKAGNYITISHDNNYYTVYMHLNKIYVSPGQTINAGDVIGTIGNTGNVIPAPTESNPYSGTHLHFCVYIGRPYQGGYEINPMSLY